MAGRGTDIILGGNADFMARLKVRERIMPKLVQLDVNNPMAAAGGGRRQKKGFTPGKQKTWAIAPEFYPCELSERTDKRLDEAVDAAVAKFGPNKLPELQVEEILAIASEKAPVDDAVVLHVREVFQQIRNEYENITDAEHNEVVELGGLHVIGTERHESRRIDNQLRGRCARQGDPGSTRFFLSLEDNLLRIFGGDRIGRLMDMFRVEEDMPIEHPMLNSSLENAQKKVETYYYDIRKQVFEYDEVMNNQRKAIYTERRRALEGDNLKDKMIEFCGKTMDDVLYGYVNPDLPPEEWELDKLISKVKEFVPQLQQLSNKDVDEMGFDEMQEYLREQIVLAYEAQESYVDTFRSGLMRDVERFYLLQQIDTLWREHLQQMDALRESVGLRGYGQKDPLIEYKNEGYQQFLDMMTDIRRNTVYSLFQFKPQVRANTPPPTAAATQGNEDSGVIDAEFVE